MHSSLRTTFCATIIHLVTTLCN